MNDKVDLWEIENSLIADGYEVVCGVDEAGRGSLAGAVFASAVILPPNICISDLDDSKKLSAEKREELYDEIVSCAIAFGIASSDNNEVDEFNVLNATYLAMNRAIEKLDVKPDIALIDGNRNSGIAHKNICVIKGDSKSASIAAASILAKVSRDRYMLELAGKYPNYAFEKHKGYGTKLHYEKLMQFGASEIHRHSFLRKMRG